MMYLGIDLTAGQQAEISAAIRGLPASTAWAVFAHIGDLLRPKREISLTDVRHAIAAAYVKVGVRPRVHA